MSTVKKFTENLYVSDQLCAEDIPNIKELGVNRIICNRPDGEAADQTSFAEITELASKHGIETIYLPVSNPQAITNDIVAAFKQHINGEGNTLAYCRTGTRTTWIWAFGAIEDTPVAEVIKTASEANYDISALANMA